MGNWALVNTDFGTLVQRGPYQRRRTGGPIAVTDRVANAQPSCPGLGVHSTSPVEAFEQGSGEEAQMLRTKTLSCRPDRWLEGETSASCPYDGAIANLQQRRSVDVGDFHNEARCVTGTRRVRYRDCHFFYFCGLIKAGLPVKEPRLRIKLAPYGNGEAVKVSASPSISVAIAAN